MDVRTQSARRRGAFQYLLLMAAAISAALMIRAAAGAEEKPVAAIVATALAKGGEQVSELPPYLPKAPVKGKLAVLTS